MISITTITLSSCLCGNCKLIRVGTKGHTMLAPHWLYPRGWSLNFKGYAQFTSRCIEYHRGSYAQRIIMARLLDESTYRPPSTNYAYHVHHQDGIKLNNCPLNLMAITPELHQSNPRTRQCPYTGRFMTQDDYERLLGYERIPPQNSETGSIKVVQHLHVCGI